MKKRICLTFVCMIAALVCAFGLVACTGKTPDSGSGGNEGEHSSHVWSTNYIEEGDRHYQTCSGCNEKQYGDHIYNAIGYCICGKAKPDEGEENPPVPPAHAVHTFDQETVDSKYLAQPATCEHKAEYYYSCECGEKGIGIFEYGDLLQHTEETMTGKAATCKETGLTDGKKCSVCGKVLVEQSTIPVSEHTEETITGKAATCTEDGLTDGKKCSVCGIIIVEQTVILANGHKFDNGVCPFCGTEESPATISEVTGGTINDLDIYMFVEHDVTEVNLLHLVICSPKSTWKLYEDKRGQHEIATKIASGENDELNNGSNVFYIVATSENGIDVNTYTLTIYRSFEISINYYNGDIVLKTEKAFTGHEFSTDYTPEIVGYTFNEWKNGSETFTNAVLWDNLVLNADKTALTFTVSFVTDSKAQAVESLTATYDQEVTLPTSSKMGYTFNGWLIDSEISENTFVWNFIEDKEYTAKFTANEYTITYVPNGGTLASTTQKVTYDGEYTLYNISRLGYTFEGYTNENKEFTSGVYTIADNVTINAEWEIITYTITYNFDERTINAESNPTTYTVEDNITFANGTKTGYTFNGWYSEDSYANAVTEICKGTVGDKVLYAKTTANEYTVSITKNESAAGSISGAGVHCYDDIVTVSATTNAGYNFIGWYDSEDRLLSDETSYVFDMGFDTTIQAKWNYYTVTTTKSHSAAGTVTNYYNTKVSVGNSVTITANTNQGYTWVGWYNGEQELTKGLSYTFEMSAENVTYTAKWTYYTVALCNTIGGSVSGVQQQLYVLKFNLNGGSGSIPSQTPTDEKGLTYPTIPTRTGYVFGGWYTNSNCTGFPFDFSAALTADTTLYAKWIAYSGSGVLPLNGNLSVSVVSKSSSTMQYYAFVPLVSGDITVYTQGSLDTYGYLYNSAKSQLTYDDDGGDGSNFSITYAVAAGNLYYVRPCGYSTSGNTTIYLTAVMPTAGGQGFDNKVTAGESVTVTATTDVGYTWLGWYNGEQELTKELQYSFTMPAESVTYTAKWTVKDEMSNFIFISTPTTCTITGIRDKTITDIFVPDYVTSIASVAFEDCSNLTRVTIGNSVTSIGDSAFEGCSGLTSVTIPNSVTSIGDSAFYGCSSLVSATIGNSVTSIGNYAFEDCSGLTSVKIGNSVTSIGSSAFYNCSELTSITIPDSVTSIGNSAFGDCDGLTSIYYTGDINGWCGISGLSNLMSSGSSDRKLYINGEEITGELIIPYDVKTIGSFAFYNCSGLTSITIPNSVTSVGSSAFEGCCIETATIPGIAISSMPKSSLKIVRITNGSIGSSAFNGCSELTSVTIDNSVTSIGDSAFSGCISLTDVTIGGSVTSIGSSAFKDCSGLTSVTIPNKVTSIGSSAFSGCSGLTSITIPNSVTSVGSSAFEGCRFETATIPGVAISSMPKSSLKIVRITNGSVGSYAFSGCSGLTSVTIDNSVTSIGSYAFNGCSGLTSVTIGNSVTSIGSSAFSGCSSLMSITIPFVGGSRKTASDTYQYPFGYIFGTSSYTGGTETQQSYHGSSTNSMMSATYYIPASLKSVTITSGNILDGAFYNCSGLTSVTLPYIVTSIGNSAFYGCSKLTSITIPDLITSIEGSAFEGCSGLTSITIGNSVTSIGSSAFRNCSRLTSITIPDLVTIIGSYAFNGCSGLTSVTIGNSVTSIGNYAFNGCSGITSITIPGSVDTIGNYAFFGCNSLTSAIFVKTGVWYVSKDGISSGSKLEAADLSKPATAAYYLTGYYYASTWTRYIA